MPNDEKIGKVIHQIIRQTTEGSLKWTASYPPDSLIKGTSYIIEDYFDAHYKDQWVAVFERRYKGFDPDSESNYWTSEIVFAFISQGGKNAMWETNDAPQPLVTLFKVAKESAADIDGILDRMLS